MQKNWQYKWNLNGVELKAEISPCSWMYDNYGTQLSVTEPNGAVTYPIVKIPFESVLETDLITLCNTVELVKCNKCNNLTFKDPKSNRKGDCEVCFMKEMNIELEKIQKKQDIKLKKQTQKMIKQGFIYHAIVSAYPINGGDDIILDIWFKEEPTKQIIANTLKKSKLTVCNYQVVKEV